MSKVWFIAGVTMHGMALAGVLILLALLGFGAMGAWGQAPPAGTAAGEIAASAEWACRSWTSAFVRERSASAPASR